MSSRLGGKLSRLETAIGGRRFTREQLKTLEARFAHGLGVYLDSEAAADVHPEQKVAAKRDIDRAILADVALASGSAAGLAPAYREEITEWSERLNTAFMTFLMMALASEGLADWCSKEPFWVFPGEGDPTGESEFVTERRGQRALELVRELLDGDEGMEQMRSKANAAAELTEQKRRECNANSPRNGWSAADEEQLRSKLEQIRRARAAREDEDE